MSEPYQIGSPLVPIKTRTAYPRKIGIACVEFIFGPLADDPQRVGRPLRDELAGLRSARRGDYRVHCGTTEETHQIEIVHIGRRSDVYR